MNNTYDEINKTKQLASIIFMNAIEEESGPNEIFKILKHGLPKLNLPKIEKTSSITSRLILIKIPSYGVKVINPDWLIYLIDLCGEGNPGYIQLIYKELLEYINDKIFNKQGIDENYKITTDDFSKCFINYPIISDPKINKKYSLMWDNQKKKHYKSFESDNLVDTPEYWLEVMKNNK